MNNVTKLIISDIATTRERENMNNQLSSLYSPSSPFYRQFNCLLEKTLGRLTTFTLVSILFFIATSLWEYFYLRKFFISHKVA
jgi:hypothetical protein